MGIELLRCGWQAQTIPLGQCGMTLKYSSRVLNLVHRTRVKFDRYRLLTNICYQQAPPPKKTAQKGERS